MQSMDQVAATLSAQILPLEQSLLRPKERADADDVEALLAADFMEFGSSGRVWSRPATIARVISEGADASVDRRLSNFSVRQLSDDVVLATYTVARPTAQGPDVRTLRSSIWTRAGGRWQMTFHQGTPAAAGE